MNKHRPISHVELILQTSPAENGAAALAMVLSYYQHSVPLAALMEHSISSAADLVTAAQRQGLYAQGYQMTFEELAQAPMPLIAHWKFHSFVVVTGVRGGRVHILSPEEGRLVVNRQEFEAAFTGVAICFASQDAPAPAPARREKLTAGAAAPAVLAAAQALITALCLLLAVLSREVAAQLYAPQAGNSLTLCLGLLLGLLLQAAAAAVQSRELFRLRRQGAGRARQAFEAFLQKSGTTFFQKTNGYRLDVVARACDAIPDAHAQIIASRLQLAGTVACIAVVALQNIAAGVAAAVVAAVFTAICYHNREKLYSDLQLADRERFLASDRAAGDLEDAESYQLRGEAQTRFQHWASMAGCVERPKEVHRQKSAWYLAAAAQLLVVMLTCLAEMAMGRAGTADLAGCMALTAGAAVSMGAVPRLMEAQMAHRWLRELTKSLERYQEEETPAPRRLEEAQELTLQSVSLRQKGGEAVVARDVTFTVRRGEVLVVSAEAEACAALAPVAAGLEQPRQGAVYLDRTELTALTEQERCRNIGLLGGGIPFPAGTVRQNIAAGLPQITDYAVVEAASDALLHTSILQRREGYDTPASTLSEGERILLEFACAFARETPFLVCNGLTERLDPDTEDRLLQALRRRRVGAVLLSGDPAQMQKGDLVCRIEHGQVTLRERGALIQQEVFSLA